MRFYNIDKKIGVIPILILYLCILSSCNKINEKIGITATVTPSITPSATMPKCPPVDSLPIPEKANLSTSLIVILFDPFNYKNPDELSVFFNLISNVIQNIIVPGDHYAILRLGCHSYECARALNDDTATLAAPLIADTPSPQPTLNQLGTPTYLGQTLFEKTKIAREYDEAIGTQFATETQIAFDDYCANSIWIEKYATIQAEWKETQSVAKSISLTQIAEDVESHQINADYSNLYAPNMVFEGLGHATIILENECKKYDRCILIIFDNLDDWRIDSKGRPQKPVGININLNNVEVLTIMIDCDDIYCPVCKNTQKNWTPAFISYGANEDSVQYHNADDLEQFLISFLRR